MKGLANYTAKSLRANRVRTAVTIAGVALAAALVTAVLTTFTSLAHFLYQAEVAYSGTWMAMAEVADEDELDAGLARVAVDPDITDTAILRTVGYGSLTEEQQDSLGRCAVIQSGEGDLGTVLGVKASEGRMPAAPGEILLYRAWRTYGNVQVGDDLTMPVGQLDAEGDPSEDIQIKNAQERTFTVVGFYDKVSYALVSRYGTVAITAPAVGADEVPIRAFVSMADMADSTEVAQTAEGLFPDASVELHTALLRYLGIPSETSMWTTFYGLICVLVAVIMLACVSLIFNAFNISVAERIRQFGLLSSIGASRGQLRRAVLLEALLVAVVGIPLGLLLGIGGCWVTFAFLGPAISDLAGAMSVPFELWVDMRMVALSAALTLVTVLISAWIPAARASRMNVIDAIRTMGSTQISKRGAKRAAKAASPEHLWKDGGLGARLFGVGGKLAQKNRTRSKVKGRAASVSLALAVVLLMTAGSLNAFLGQLLDVASNGEPAAEVSVTAQFAAKGEPDGAPMTAQELADERDATLAEEMGFFQGVYDELSGAEGAVPRGWVLSGQIPVCVPASMVGAGLSTSTATSQGMADGDVAAMARVFYVSDEAFDAYAAGLGLDPAAFHEAGARRAIGLSEAYGNDGRMYQLLEMLREPGTVEALRAGVFDGTLPVAFDVDSVAGQADDAGFVPYLEWRNDKAAPGDVLDMDEVQTAWTTLEVVALAEDSPAVAGGPGEGIKLIVPMSLAEEACLLDRQPLFRSYFDPADGDHEALAQELNDIGHEALTGDEVPYQPSFVSYNDHRAEADSNQMLATVVNVFCLLFTGILALIALGNVFNTVTNSLILRRREFAVMQSVGMSTRQFRRMIADECAAFSMVGLVPGLALSAVVSALVWFMVSLSLGGVPFSLPWGYVALAVGLTVVVMVASVAYGMHRCRAGNVVEALRTE